MPAIDISQLSATIVQELNAYQKSIINDLSYVVTAVAKDTVEQLKQTSPIGYTGNYAESWAQKIMTKWSAGPASRVVYSQDPQYRKTHLLENGHDVKRDGRVIGYARPRIHIASAESRAEDQLVKQLTKRLGG